MEKLQEIEIVQFLKENIEPLEYDLYGTSYRASIQLVDGTYLPCVIFRKRKARVDLAIRRFSEEQKKPIVGYYNVVESFVTSGNRINCYEISAVYKSKFAFPRSILKQIRGETRMGWTAFVAKMKDGKCFSFGTGFSMDFFDMPESYKVQDIEEIVNHSYTLKTGEVVSYGEKATHDNYDVVYRERPYFECFIDNL